MAPDLRPRVSAHRSWVVVGLTATLALVRLLGIEVGAVTVLPLAFYPYLVGLAALLLIVPWRAGQVTQLVATLAALALAVVPLVPRAVTGAIAAEEGAIVLRVATLNMFFGSADAAEVVAIATEVEVLALLEVTEEGIQRLTEAGIAQVMPYRTVDLRPDAGGTGIWSRYPLTAGDLLDGRYAMPSAAVTVPGVDLPVTVRAVHPVPPTGGDVRAWSRELSVVAAQPTVDVLLGDFNATLDHRSLRAILRTGYADVAASLGQGYAATWPAQGLPLPGIVIDHVLAGPGVVPRALEVRDVAGSDHRALLATLDLTR